MPHSSSDLPSIACVPQHVAIIMDGNGRWATRQGQSRTQGHLAGTETARRITETALQYGITHLTLYTFSQENWKRPKAEVSFLFNLLVSFISNELPSLEKKGVALRTLGHTEKLPLAVRTALHHAIHRTKHNNAMILNLALNYSGQQEIVDACMAYMADGGEASALSPEIFSRYLYTAQQPAPDLIIRTSGELRLSNFLPFQSAYSELYFTPVLWPDFSPHDFAVALQDFASRKRRYGGLDTKNEAVIAPPTP